MYSCTLNNQSIKHWNAMCPVGPGIGNGAHFKNTSQQSSGAAYC